MDKRVLLFRLFMRRNTLRYCALRIASYRVVLILHHSRMNRIQLDVPVARQQVSFRINQPGLITPFL